MASINQAIIVGFVGDEPKIITTQSGKKMASFSIATTEKGYQRADGTIVSDKTDWHNITVFGRIAEVVEKYVHKGSSLYIQGKISYRMYEDKQTRQKRYITEIIADTLQMLDRKAQTVQTIQSASIIETANFGGQTQQFTVDDDFPF